MAKKVIEKSVDDLNNNARPVKLQLRKGANVQPIVAEWIADILEGKKVWTLEGIRDKGEEFTELIQKVFQIALENLILSDKDKFIEKTDALLTADTKRALWDRNHNNIIAAISNLTSTHNRFPTRSELAIETALTRVTINKHLAEYFNSAEHRERQEEFIVMRERVLASAFKYATAKADMKAAKIFLDATAMQQAAMKIKNQQNNFIQINGVTITKDQLNQLPQNQQLQLQKILNAVKTKGKDNALDKD